MCSVPTFFLVSAVQDASQNFILHNRNRLGQAMIRRKSITEMRTRRVSKSYFRGSIQAKGGEETRR
jgi:hypothetical protein